MIVPANMLSDEALRGMIEEFVTRDGTDYGSSESSLQERVAQVQAQILKGEALIHFDSATGQTNIIAATELANVRKANAE